MDSHRSTNDERARETKLCRTTIRSYVSHRGLPPLRRKIRTKAVIAGESVTSPFEPVGLWSCRPAGAKSGLAAEREAFSGYLYGRFAAAKWKMGEEVGFLVCMLPDQI